MPYFFDTSPSGRRTRLLLTISVVGFALGAVMVARSQMGGDQANLFLIGWLFYDQGLWLPFGNPMSGGGFEPGGLTALVVGLPLFMSEHFRSVNAFILLTHVLAYFLLDRVVRDALGPRERVLFAVFYWLNPWRAYFSGHLWNPNYLFLIGAVHLWTAYRQRDRGRFWPSFFHVLVVGAAFQLHGSFLILAIASVVLWYRCYLRPHWGGVAAGAAVVSGSLVPWVLAVFKMPELLPGHEGFLGRGLVSVYPLFRGVLYWLRYSSLHFGRDLLLFDFGPFLGASADAVLAPVFRGFAQTIGVVSVLGPLLANIWLWRRGPGARWSRIETTASGREWVAGYTRWSFVAAVASFSLSPTTIMSWQALIVVHAAVLPVVLWGGVLLQSPHQRRYRAAFAACAVTYAVMLSAMAVASPLYRKGGRDGFSFVQRQSSEMLERAGIAKECTVTIGPGDRSPTMFKRLERMGILSNGDTPPKAAP